MDFSDEYAILGLHSKATEYLCLFQIFSLLSVKLVDAECGFMWENLAWYSSRINTKE